MNNVDCGAVAAPDVYVTIKRLIIKILFYGSFLQCSYSSKIKHNKNKKGQINHGHSAKNTKNVKLEEERQNMYLCHQEIT
jgi:hypothetical protein